MHANRRGRESEPWPSNLPVELSAPLRSLADRVSARLVHNLANPEVNTFIAKFESQISFPGGRQSIQDSAALPPFYVLSRLDYERTR